MKRTITFLLTAAVLILSFCGCGDGKKESTDIKSASDTAASVPQYLEGTSDEEPVSGQTESWENKPSAGAVSDTPSGKAVESAASSVSSVQSGTQEKSETETPTEEETKPQVYLMADYTAEGIRLSVRVMNNTGIAGMLIGINYDESKVTPVSISKSKIKVTSNLQQSNASLHGVVTAVYASEKGFDNDCEMFYIMFEPKGEGITEFSISAESNAFVGIDDEYLDVDTSKTVKVKL